jgi:hypothetical protein
VGTSSADGQRIAQLEREVRELRRANDMADSTGERNGSCEMSESRSQENVDVGHIRPVGVDERDYLLGRPGPGGLAQAITNHFALDDVYGRWRTPADDTVGVGPTSSESQQSRTRWSHGGLHRHGVTADVVNHYRTINERPVHEVHVGEDNQARAETGAEPRPDLAAPPSSERLGPSPLAFD